MVNPISSAKAMVSATASDGQMNSSGTIDTTFLQLLTTELQSQDPTSPMDSTQMVGQMVSLNQLDQLIAIHELLQQAASGNPAPANNGGN